MAEVRQRTTPATTSDSKTSDPAVPIKKLSDSSSSSSSSSSASSNRFSVTDVLRILGGLLLLNCAISYFVTSESIAWGYRPWFSKPESLKAWFNGPLLLTDTDLLAYDGSDPTKPIYIALNGSIYDVSVGRHFYGPGGSYSFFAGRDATRAFVTGCFDTDLTPDLRGAEETYIPVDVEGVEKTELTPAQEKIRRELETRIARKKVQDTIEGWATMFRGDGAKNYFKVGEVKREGGWLEKLPKRELCARAQKQRPKRKA